MHNRTRATLAGLAIVLAVVVVYAPSFPGEFIWDDDAHVAKNELLVEPGGLSRIWIPHNTQQYYPLSFTAWWVQFRLWGLEPFGYRAVNLLLHAVSACLLWRLLRRLAVPGAYWIGLAFAIHPMNVESVAWVMELKNCLSLTLMLAAAHAWLAFERRRDDGEPATGAWALAFALFVLALLAKTVTAALAPALILARLWQRKPLRLAPLAPFFAVGIGLGLFTAWIEKVDIHAAGPDFAFSLVDRFELAARALVHYAAKIVWPAELLFVYPRTPPGVDGVGFAWRAAVVVLAIVAVLALWARGRRGPALSLFLFAGLLFPALGFLDVYPFVFSFVADHFGYLASMGALMFLFGGLFTHLPARARVPVAVLACVALGLRTWNHAAVFGSGRALYEHTLEANPDAWLCHSLLATLDVREGREFQASGATTEARARFERAVERLELGLERRPDDSLMLFTYGFALYRLGRFEEALVPARKAANRPPHSADSYAVVGLVQRERGEPVRARGWFERALAQDATNYTANFELGRLEENAGNADAARRYYAAAVAHAPDAGTRERAETARARVTAN